MSQDFDWELGVAPEESDTYLIGDRNSHRIFARVVGAPEMPALPRAQLMVNAPQLLWLLTRLVNELPYSRNWLDPTLERMAKRFIAELTPAPAASKGERE